MEYMVTLAWVLLVMGLPNLLLLHKGMSDVRTDDDQDRQRAALSAVPGVGADRVRRDT